MFKFNFAEENEGEDLKAFTSESQEIFAATNENCTEVFSSDAHIPALNNMTISALGLEVANSYPVNCNQQEYDLISGVYEGGHVIWECSIDLCNYIQQNNSTISSYSNCLELGCGAGIPGIMALLSGIQLIVYSDFNKEVLQQNTWPNIKLNVPDWEQRNIRCFAGDWLALSSFIQDHSSDMLPLFYDLILSAETLYSEDSCRKIFEMINKHLSSSGEAIIANKKYYFGVGGGTQTLRSYVNDCSSLQIVADFIIEDGISNIREILILRRRSIPPT